MNRKYRIGIALGSGAARGLAHMGVIEVLRENNIPIDIVAGSSSGALIGALYCAGIDFKYIKALCKNLHQKDYIDIAVPRTGFIKGEIIQEIIKLLTKNCEFKDLVTPLIVVATDLRDKKLKIINEGKVHEAVRGSISIPGVFIPFYKDDMVLVDGGVLERVPSKVLKNMGIDLVIGVDVGFNLTASNCKSIFNVLFESYDLMERELFMFKKHEADILIDVDLKDIDPIKFDQVDLCIEKGRAAAEASIGQIKNTIKELEKSLANV